MGKSLALVQEAKEDGRGDKGILNDASHLIREDPKDATGKSERVGAAVRERGHDWFVQMLTG